MNSSPVGFFDKAKRTFFKPKEDSAIVHQSGEHSPPEQLGGISGYDPSWWEDQELGKAWQRTCYILVTQCYTLYLTHFKNMGATVV